MKFTQLATMVWDDYQTTQDWIDLLKELLELIKEAKPEELERLADTLDEFADRSTSENLTTIAKLDASARKTARALRDQDVDRRIQELSAASADYRSTVKEFKVVTEVLKKEATVLRLEKVNAAAASLTSAISSLKNLALAIDGQDEEKLKDAIRDTITSAQTLREILEKAS